MTEGNGNIGTPMSEVLAEFLPDIARLAETKEPETRTEAAAEVVEEELEEGTEEQEGAEADGESETETGETAEEDEDEPKESKDQAKGWPDSARKRVDKLTAKLREAEEARERAEAERARLAAESQQPPKQQTAQATTSGGVLEEVWDESSLMDRADAALNWKRWAIENPDGGTIAVNGAQKEYSEEDVKKILMNADRMLAVEIPKRREFLQQAVSVESALRADYPEAFDQQSEEWKGIVEALGALPDLKRRPDGMVLALALSLGMKNLQTKRTEKAEKSNPPKKAEVKAPARLAPKPVGPVAVPKPGPSKPRANAMSVTDLLERGGDVDALTKFFTTGT
jgi:hypothetical protein